MNAAVYDEVRSYLVSLPDLRRGEGATNEDLKELANVWGPLPLDFKHYLHEFGWVAFRTYELYGLGRDIPPHLHLLDRTAELWRGDGIYAIPRELLPLYESGGGWFYCLSKMHAGQPVVCWAQEYEDLGDPQPYDERYPSWSDWMMQHILSLHE